MIHYKKDILKELAEKGYSSTRLRKEKILSESTMQKIRKNDTSLSLDNVNRICCILRCQVSDIIEVTPTDEEKIKYF